MRKGILGEKMGMTQYFLDSGESIPVTVVRAGPCVVVQRRKEDKDGYEAVQLGYGDISEEKLTKPMAGHFKRAGVAPKRYLKEIRLDGDENGQYQEGEEIGVDLFEAGERVDVTGTSKGKGFAGVIKRWGFRGGPASHGSRFKRAPGSMGASADPSRVFKGKRLPGQMGNDTVTIQALEIVKVDPERNLLLLKGSVPGPKKNLLIIRESRKSS